MKRRIWKRAIALWLCIVMVLTSGAFAYATEESTSCEICSTEPCICNQSGEAEAASAEPEEVIEESQETSIGDQNNEIVADDSETDQSEETEEESKEESEKETEEESKEESEKETEEESKEESEEESKKETEKETEEESKKETEEETEEETQVLEYEDDDVKVHISGEDGAIPKGASLKVTPITEHDKEYDEIEKQLNKKAEGEEYEIAGFLAYDICLVDKDGNEVEPGSQIKVSMEYKKAATPKGIENAEAMDVTVMHLEEDENGEVKEVVDMVKEKAVTSLQTTEHQEMEKVEFETESFSTFTITWTSQGTFTFNFLSVNANGDRGTRAVLDVLNQEDYNLTLDGNEEFDTTVDGINEKYKEVRSKVPDDGSNTENGQFIYQFKEVRNIWNSNVKEDTGSVVTGLRRQDGQLQWKDGNGVWQNRNNQDKFYFIYIKYEPELTTVATVDHEADGIIMTMTNHSLTSHDDQWKKNYLNLGGGYNDAGGQGIIRKGLVQRILGADGYPKTTSQGNSIKSAFTNSWDDARSHNSKQVNHLFRQDIYNATGYYEYSSFENFAYLGDSSNFTVYEQIGAPYQKDDYANTQYYTMRGNFLPYSPIERGYFSGNINSYDEDGNALSQSAARYHEPIYKTKGVDYRFGMYLEVPFFQPRNGMVEFKGSTSAMRYEFNGDDDMWVFVDNVLLLDIGGIHDAHSGYIDFSTGIIGWEDCATGQPSQEYTTTIKQRYYEAGIFPDGSTWDDSKVDDYFKGNTFADYTAHTMKMFYMERGYGASNLHLKFNLATIPRGNVTVMKEVPEEFQTEYADRQFAYQIYAQKITGKDGAGRETYSDTEYVSLDSNATVEFHDNVKIGEETYNDVFYLKPGQKAVFTNLQENRKYYVVELGVNAEEFIKVNAAGEIYTLDATGYEDIETTKSESSDRPIAVFVNTPASELQIKKTMAPNQSTTDSFTFKVEFVNANGEFQAYRGSYSLKKADGTVSQGSTTNGEISGVNVGDTVIIKKLALGTEFRVTEVGYDGNKYKTPVKTLVENTYGTASHTDADGKIIAIDAQVEIQNNLKFCIQVKKEWSGITPDTYKEGIYVGLYKKVEDAFVPVSPEEHKLLNSANQWKETFYELDKSTEYDVKELRKIKENETAEFTISGEGYIAVESEERITIKDLQFDVYNSGVVENADNVGLGQVTITNDALWQIVKTNSSESTEQLELEGAVFELTNGEDVFYGKSDSNGVMKWYRNCDKENGFACSGEISIIKAGQYAMEEIKAPTGYFISGEVWTISFDDKGTPASIESSLTGTTVTPAKVMDGKLTFYYENTVVYELPSSGGIGIYWGTISGMILMMGAALILHNKRCKEVLKK